MENAHTTPPRTPYASVNDPALTEPAARSGSLFFILGAIVVALGVVLWMLNGGEPDGATTTVPATETIETAPAPMTPAPDAAAPDVAPATPAPTEPAPTEVVPDAAAPDATAPDAPATGTPAPPASN